MESTAVPAAGWFPDPGGSSSERWWSGDAWTEHTRQPLGGEVPAMFAAHVDTLVAETDAPQDSAFAFAMTAAAGATVSDGAAHAGYGDEPSHPARHVVADAVPSAAEPTRSTAPAPARPPVPAALLEAQRASVSPVMTALGADPAPRVALPTPFDPAPVATATATASPAPAFAFPGFVAPSPLPGLPEGHAEPAPAAVFATPAFPAPVDPAPAAAAAAGFIMPNPAAQFAAPADAPTAPGRHADAPEDVPEPAAPAVKPAAAPVGFTASVDPEVASRYRQVIHAPEQPAGGAELGVSLGAPLAPTLGASPARSGWAGMPLPPAGGLPGDAPAPTGYAAVGYAPAPSGPVPTPGYAPPPGTNRAAVLALSAGLGSLAALAFILFGRILIVPSVLSLVAIVAGIVGLVRARRAGVGRGRALSGLLMGLATSVAVGASLVVSVLGVFAFDTSVVEDDIVAHAAALSGVDVVSATCPDDVSLLTSTSFACTAFDSAGTAYAVEVALTSDGTLEWELVV